MSTFQKTVFAVVLATTFTVVPLTSHADKKSDCKAEGGAYVGTEADGFCFKCLPADVSTLQPIQLEDPQLKLCLKGALTAVNREEALKMASHNCVSAGGALKDKGSMVTCTLRGSSPRVPRCLKPCGFRSR